MTFIRYMKDRYDYLRSFFVNGLVKTGQSFTTTDATTILGDRNTLLEMSQGKNHIMTARCVTRPDVELDFDGIVYKSGRTKYRLRDPSTKIRFDVDSKLFHVLFQHKKP